MALLHNGGLGIVFSLFFSGFAHGIAFGHEIKLLLVISYRKHDQLIRRIRKEKPGTKKISFPGNILI